MDTSSDQSPPASIPPRKIADVHFKPFRLLTRNWLGFAILLTALLPLKIMRARQENSFWIDEVYSVLLAGNSTENLIDKTTIDVNPPGYYLVLKAWNCVGKRLGFGPSLWWTRSLNVVMWVVLAAIAWFAGRAVLGRGYGTLLAWAVAGSSQVAHAAKDIRSYGFALPAMLTCFLILMLLWKRNSERSAAFCQRDSKATATDIALWGIYVLSALVGLYAHLLTVFVIFFLGLTWIVLAFRQRHLLTRFVIGGALAQGFIFLLFAPWLLRLGAQVTCLQSLKHTWMTPRTFWNLLRVFTLWYPYGRVSSPPPGLVFPTYLLGALSIIAPLGAVLWAAKSSRGKPVKNPMLMQVAIAGLGISGCFVVLLFLLHRFNVAQVFHGPRYPALTAPFWAAGLVAAAGWATQRMNRPPHLALWLLMPLLLCAAVGQWWIQSLESRGGIPLWKHIAADFFPVSGEPLYVLTPELIPYFRESLADYDAQSIEEIAHVSPEQKVVYVLDLNPCWERLRTPRDMLILALLKGGHLSAAVDVKEVPKVMKDFRNFRLRNFNHEAARRLLGGGIQPASRAIPKSSATCAFPENQLLTDGWSVLEIGNQMSFCRWAIGRKTRIKFEGSIAPGKYKLHLIGFRSRYPENRVEMKFHFSHEREIYKVHQTAGSFHIVLQGKLTRPHQSLRLIVKHPVWRPVDFEENSKDTRPLTFLFQYAWLEVNAD